MMPKDIAADSHIDVQCSLAGPLLFRRILVLPCSIGDIPPRRDPGGENVGPEGER